ncbi:putative GNAT family N-acyltransferase [Ochrobactrum daejeonense]|uniref:Putative GNAT family N-acyltransferase n=1 Tax=Brucella daejeonensis TaxID=659015 RepID=A0A7W9AVM4_9HYPH|nr:GNAT family N-acetyltransferase [Brucella daejeonensis]MBB5701408.1 putative GNAT family N-acyltransferase [Brucella daejeonensis]NKB78809.1 GNAT family N-acetyltransferase [Brucella daejeonensis]
MKNFQWLEELPAGRHREFHAFYCREWWTGERSFEDVTHMLAHCDLLLFCLDVDGRIAGFARVLSDFTFKAMIFDVIVAAEHRGQGLGQALVQRVLSHEKLRRVKSFELYCPDRLVPFYEKLGFVKGTSSLLFNQP